jgi:solute:Na+ symporter, SSS family
MHPIDWFVLIGTLAGIVFYGTYKTKGHQETAENFLQGDHNLRWWTIGLSIMATQASAITFLSTPGQAYTDGLQFIQFYFGMPIAMLFLVTFVLPIYYKLRVTTAYEYLEQRFDLRMRTLTAMLFLIQRGVAAAISIYAPSLIFCAVFGWNLGITNALMALFVVIYTTSGGSNAVSKTQELQMSIIMGSLVLAFIFVLLKLPSDISISDAWQIANVNGKTQILDWSFDWHDRYNVWSGILGATFLFLSYFGTDQSQVGRYLSGKTLKESRFGLLFNGFVKIPMQFLVLSVGVMVFVFYQFNKAPLHFNQANRAKIEGTAQETAFKELEAKNDAIFDLRQSALKDFKTALKTEELSQIAASKLQLQNLEKQRNDLRIEADALLKKTDATIETKDKDYVFINFVLNHLPIGVIGLVLAMIFCASWSTTASELNALTATSVSDIYRRSFAPNLTDAQFLKASKIATVCWGVFIMIFATYAQLFDNLIQAVNMIGSIFYGTILGIFFTAFFLKKVGGQAVFYAACITQCIILYLFFQVDKDAYLWYNPLGCGLVMLFSLILEVFIGKSEIKMVD